MRTVDQQIVEERFITAEPYGDDAQEAGLEVQDTLVEGHEDLADTGEIVIGEHLIAVAVRIMGPKWMVGWNLAAPVEHLLPIRSRAAGGGLDEQTGVARLPVRLRHRVAAFRLGRQAEKVGQHPI